MESIGQDPEFIKLVTQLSTFGLSSNQSKVYLFLLSRGKSSGREISNSLGVHRVDVYRKIHELQELGLLETEVSSPKKYTAVEPRIALTSLIQRKADRIELEKKQIKSVLPELISYKGRLGKNNQVPFEDWQPFNSEYSLVVGRLRYYSEIERLIGSARSEVLRIVSAGGVIRTFKAGLFDSYVEAKKRGVKLRMITEITDNNRKLAKKLSSVVLIRHLTGVHLRFTVIDNSVSVLSARFDENSLSVRSPSDSYLVLRDPKFTEAFKFFFEHVWKGARPFP